MGKYTQDKVIIFGGLGTIAAILTAVVIGIQRKKKIIKQIEKKIATGDYSSGTLSDLSSSKAFNENYWKQVSGSSLITYAKAMTYARQLYCGLEAGISDGQICTTTTYSKVLDVFKKLKNQAQVSQVASAYYNSFGNESLYKTLLDKRSTGAGFLNWADQFDIFGMLDMNKLQSKSIQTQVSNYIKSLPLK